MSIQNLLLNQEMSNTEQENILLIQKNTQEYLNLSHYNLNQINQLMIIIHDRLNYAKDYTDYRNRMKSFVQLVHEGNFIRPSLKSFEEIFPIIYDTILDKPIVVVFRFLAMLFLSLLTIYSIKKYTSKQLNPIKKSFYLHTRFTFLILYPLTGLFFITHHKTNPWLIQPAGLIFIRWAIIMCFIKICSMHYLCFLSGNITVDKFNRLSKIIQKLIYILLFVGVFQFFTLNCFDNGDIIDLGYLIFIIPIFCFYYTYYMIQMIIELTTVEYFPLVSAFKLDT